MLWKAADFIVLTIVQQGGAAHRRGVGMRVLALLLLATVTSGSALASGQSSQFVQISDGEQTSIYDLTTVNMILPGRFTIVRTTIDDPDVMNFELKVSDTLYGYCGKAAGNYPPSATLLPLGPADMHVGDIEVNQNVVVWDYPYKRLSYDIAGHVTEDSGDAWCGEHQAENYTWQRQAILNGLRSKVLFDCGRGLYALFFPPDVDETPSTKLVRTGTAIEYEYLTVCHGVIGRYPYLPK